MIHSGNGILNQVANGNKYTYSNTFGIKEFGKLLRDIKIRNKLRRFREEMDGQKEVEIGDVVIAGTYYEGYGVTIYRVIGETPQYWKVKHENSNGYGYRDKISKVETVYNLGNNDTN